MIDSIVITLSREMYRITEPDKFMPSARWAMTDTYRSSGIVSRQNATQKELKQGIYKPRITLSNRFTHLGIQAVMLKMEISLPKLMFGNNFNELRYKDFDAVVHKLAAILETMGISVTPEALAQAAISTIHYSKNIPLTDGSTPYHYIQKIKQANVKLALDVNQTDYRNEGHPYKWHCNSYEVVFYDKIKDLEKAKLTPKRAMEKDSALQLKLLNRFQTRRNKFEVLRMEVRLNNRKKIKHLFKALDIKADLTLKKLFKPAISKKVLLHYLDELESKRPLLLNYKPANSRALLADLVFYNPDMNPKQIFQIYGLKIALDTANLRELRNMFETYDKRGRPATRSFSRGWYRFMNDVAKVKLPDLSSPLRQLREKLEDFKHFNV